jgi:phosphoribosyl-AMP cyclohydrolase
LRKGVIPHGRQWGIQPLTFLDSRLRGNDDFQGRHSLKKRWIDEVKFNSEGLIPAVAQDAKDGTVLMLAYMNKTSLEATFRTGRAAYWSRSRQKLWIKGEESGNIQKVKSVHLDCDGDALVLKIVQVGGAACHTGHRSCFYRRAIFVKRKRQSKKWVVEGKPVFDPTKVYSK